MTEQIERRKRWEEGREIARESLLLAYTEGRIKQTYNLKERKSERDKGKKIEHVD